MKCPKCMAENPDGAEYCSLCFTRFDREDDIVAREEKARKLLEESPGAMIGCPSCQEVSPVGSRFCLKCGFIFDEPEQYLISAEEVESRTRRREERRRQEAEAIAAEPIEVNAESVGSEVMRGIGDSLRKSRTACIHARGRNATTYAMKIIAMMSDEYREKGESLVLRVSLATDGSVTDLEEVELEIVLEAG